MKNKTVCLLLLPLLLTLAGCTLIGNSSLQPVETHPSNLATDPNIAISFPRQKKTNGEWAAMDALARGTLVLIDNCIRLKVNDSETSYMLIWPPDFSLMDENGTIKVLNENNKTVAFIGDKVQMSGGEIKYLMLIDKSIQGQMPSQCTEPFWLIGYEFATIDSSK
jgi:hypothetical protein